MYIYIIFHRHKELQETIIIIEAMTEWIFYSISISLRKYHTILINIINMKYSKQAHEHVGRFSCVPASRRCSLPHMLRCFAWANATKTFAAIPASEKPNCIFWTFSTNDWTINCDFDCGLFIQKVKDNLYFVLSFDCTIRICNWLFANLIISS